MSKAGALRVLLCVAFSGALSLGAYSNMDRAADHLSAPVKTARVTPRSDVMLRIVARFLANSDNQPIGQFMRGWRIRGPELCRALRQAGIATTDWQQPSLRSVTYECNFLRVFRRDESRPLSSLFLRVRGTSKGDIIDVRGTILDPTSHSDESMDTNLKTIFTTIVSQTQWKDLEDSFRLMNKFGSIDHRKFGVSLTFSRDNEDLTRYDFSLSIPANSNSQLMGMAHFLPRQSTTPQ